METQPHNIDDKYIIMNSMGREMHFTGEMIAWNSILMIVLAVAALLVMINRFSDDSKNNSLLKLLYGGLAVVSLAGLLYPIEFGLIGINLAVIIILTVDFFKYDKKKRNGNK